MRTTIIIILILIGFNLNSQIQGKMLTIDYNNNIQQTILLWKHYSNYCYNDSISIRVTNPCDTTYKTIFNNMSYEEVWRKYKDYFPYGNIIFYHRAVIRPLKVKYLHRQPTYPDYIIWLQKEIYD